MRILHLIASERLYGAARVVIELSKALKEVHNYQPIVGVMKKSYNTDTEIIDEAKTYHLDFVIFPCNRQFSLKTIFSIREYLKNNRIDFLHCHGYKSNFYGLVSSKNKIPMVTTNHNWITSHWKLKIYCLLDALLIRCFDKIVAVSDEIKQRMLKYRIPENKIKVIDNGVDLGRFNKEMSTGDIKREFNITGDVKVIGTIGSIKYEKGHTYLLKTAKSIIDTHKSIKFLIVGDGNFRGHLEKEAVNLGIQGKVIFTGYRKDITELLSIIDIFVLPSLKEGLPMVMLEAMAAKKPVIATKVGAIPRVIQNNENGILIEPKNVTELTLAINDLLKNKDRLQKLALNGYLTVKEEYSSEIMCTNYFRLYQELIP